MADRDEPRQRMMGREEEELPQMDGSCDACEPDEAQPASQMCSTCSFAFCPAHATRHANSTHHQLMPYRQEETQEEQRPEARGGADAGARARRGLTVGRDDLLAVSIAAKIQEIKDSVVDADWEAVSEEAGAMVGEEAQADGPAEAGAEGAQAGEGGDTASGEAGKRDTMTVERLRCKEHGQEGSLYCKPDEKIICVVCAVQGEHQGHEIITLHEAFLWQKSREGHDLLGSTQQMAEKIKTKWSKPEMTTEELEAYVNKQFDELHRLVRLEEKRTLHLVDLKEAFLTASAAERIAEITVHTERLQEEMASITHQLGLLDQEEEEYVNPGVVAEAIGGGQGRGPRQPRDIEARPRLPEPRRDPMDPRDYGDNEPGPSMGHAP